MYNIRFLWFIVLKKLGLIGIFMDKRGFTMKKQILVVDDDEINREVLDAILSEDYNVLKADNGREALDILEANPENISLVILDVIMPVMDGYEVLDIIKSNPELSSIPVIFATQNDSEESEIVALEHGATDFVTKPYRPKIIKHRAASLKFP